ncbi:TPA: hypothetical protein ACH3X1_011445 [Trebouxia sp. C0004]
MSCTALWELLIRELGQEDAIRFSDVHLQNLIDKGYTDHGALKDATCDGLQSPPPLLPALVDKLLKCFKPAGRLAGALYEGGSAPSKKAKTGFQHERVRTDDSSGNRDVYWTCLGDSQDECPQRTAVCTPRS